MDNTIIQQGSFVSDGATRILQLRSDIDWMNVYNYTRIAANTANAGYQFYWQRDMAVGDAIEHRSNAGSTAVDLTVLGANGGGFTLVNTTTDEGIGASATITGLTNATPPVITTTAGAHGLSVGQIVRFYSLNNQTQINGMDFSITAVGAANLFTIGNIALANSTASTSGAYRVITTIPSFYPRRRFITFISQSATAGRAKVYLSVTHDYVIGQRVRLSLPGGVWGQYGQLDGRECTVVAINEVRAGAEPNNAGTANNIVVDVDVSALGNWNVFGAATNQCFPATTSTPFSHAEVTPVGHDTSRPDLATTFANRDVSYIGMMLGAGINAPAGQNNDVIYWTAGKSFAVIGR